MQAVNQSTRLLFSYRCHCQNYECSLGHHQHTAFLRYFIFTFEFMIIQMQDTQIRSLAKQRALFYCSILIFLRLYVHIIVIHTQTRHRINYCCCVTEKIVSSKRQILLNRQKFIHSKLSSFCLSLGAGSLQILELS